MRCGMQILLLSRMKICLFIFCCFAAKDVQSVEEHEQWWQNCLENRVSLATFEGWLGNYNSKSRVAMRRHVKEKGYTSILDVPSGLCIDYFGLKHDGIAINYQGVDITPMLVDLAQKQNLPVIQGDIKSLPFEDNQFEICYSRHILEHLDRYEQAINSLIRVASREVFITFFSQPKDTQVIRSALVDGYLLYHNIYCKLELEQFILSNAKVSKIEWEEVDENEIILHIYTGSD